MKREMHVDTLDALLDQEVDSLNVSLFQGQDANCAFPVHTDDDFDAVVDLKSRSEWQGHDCVFATRSDFHAYVFFFIPSQWLDNLSHSF